MDPVSLAIMGGMAVAGAATSAASASAQNRAIRASAASSRRAASIQDRQVQEASNLERQKRVNESQQIIGRIRVAGAAAGVDPALGSFAALQRQAVIDSELNQQIVTRNANNERERIASGLEANLTSLSARVQNPLIAMFQGGLGGASTGLQISSAIPSSAPASATVQPGVAGSYDSVTPRGQYGSNLQIA